MQLDCVAAYAWADSGSDSAESETSSETRATDPVDAPPTRLVLAPCQSTTTVTPSPQKNNNQYSYDEHRRSAAATRHSRYASGPPERDAHNFAASASETSNALRYAPTSFTSSCDASTLET